MRKFISLLFSGALLATALVGLTASPASATTTLTTCADLSNQKIKVLSATKKNCNPFLASAIWHIQQSDSSAHAGSGFATIQICSSKNPLFTYQFIKSSCPRHQVTTEYWRTVSASQTPEIATVYARGHDSAVITLATSSNAANLDAPISYYLVTDVKSGVTTRVLPGYLGRLNISGLSSESTYTFTIAAVSVDGISAISVLSQVITTGAAPVVSTTPTIVLSCAEGGDCIVGDRGPGGGFVYYVDRVTGFNCGSGHTETGSPTGGLCHYLEVAPSGWNTGLDPIKDWAVWAQKSNNVSGITDDASAFNNALAIGLGYKNSVAIVNQGNDTSTAAGLARAYAGGSKGDWYLPASAELNLLCQWGRNVTQNVTAACTGGTLNSGTGANGLFVANMYWSSSESAADYAWYQYFNLGDQFGNYGKVATLFVRPVRAF